MDGTHLLTDMEQQVGRSDSLLQKIFLLIFLSPQQAQLSPKSEHHISLKLAF